MAAVRETFGLSLLFAWAGGLAKSPAERYHLRHDHAFFGLELVRFIFRGAQQLDHLVQLTCLMKFLASITEVNCLFMILIIILSFVHLSEFTTSGFLVAKS